MVSVTLCSVISLYFHGCFGDFPWLRGRGGRGRARTQTSQSGGEALTISHCGRLHWKITMPISCKYQKTSSEFLCIATYEWFWFTLKHSSCFLVEQKPCIVQDTYWIIIFQWLAVLGGDFSRKSPLNLFNIYAFSDTGSNWIFHLAGSFHVFCAPNFVLSTGVRLKESVN